MAGWKQRKNKNMIASDSIDSELHEIINCYFIRAIRKENGPSIIAIRLPSQRKR